MNIKRAWAAFWREPEPVVVEKPVEKVVERHVAVGPDVVDVFQVASKSYAEAMRNYWRWDLPAWNRKKHDYEAGKKYGSSLYNVYAGSPPPGPEPEKPVEPEWAGRIYRTCAQAFAELGADADLTPRKALIVGDSAYILDGMRPLPLAPKPKVAKGKRA